MTFIKDRLNKDNFWNLMFWLGMSVGISCSFLFANSNIYLSSALFWLTIIAVPFTVNKFAKVSFDEHRNFLNKEGRVLNKKLLKYFVIMIIATILIFAATGSMLDNFKYELSDSIAFCLMIIIFFSIPALYFILINCPITILFNKNIWFERISRTHLNAKHSVYSSVTNHKLHSSLSPREWSTNPAYKHLSSNIYHRG